MVTFFQGVESVFIALTTTVGESQTFLIFSIEAPFGNKGKARTRFNWQSAGVRVTLRRTACTSTICHGVEPIFIALATAVDEFYASLRCSIKTPSWNVGKARTRFNWQAAGIRVTLKPSEK